MILKQDIRYKVLIDQTWRIVYQVFRPENYTAPAPTTLEAALEVFEQLSSWPSQYSVLFQFVAFLILPTSKLPDSLRMQLYEWLQPQVEDLESLREQISYRVEAFQAQQRSISSPQLLIWIEKRDDSALYTIRRVLLIKNREVYDPRLGIGAIPFDDPNVAFEDVGDEDKSLTLSQVKESLKQRLYGVALEHEIELRQLILHVFLSFNDLEWDIDRWPATSARDPELLGYRCKGVVTRITERFQVHDYRMEQPSWRQKWQELQTLKEQASHLHIFPADGLSGKGLVAQLRDSGWVGLRQTKAPPQFTADVDHPFDDFLRSGVPIALWPRQDLGDGVCQKEFESLLGCSLSDLLETLRKRRQETDLESGNHICHHLSLFWEDPALVPPELYNHQPRIRMPTS